MLHAQRIIQFYTSSCYRYGHKTMPRFEDNILKKCLSIYVPFRVCRINIRIQQKTIKFFNYHLNLSFEFCCFADIQCSVLAVPEPPLISHIGGSRIGDNAIFECPMGYRLEGASGITCQYNGTKRHASFP